MTCDASLPVTRESGPARDFCWPLWKPRRERGWSSLRALASPAWSLRALRALSRVYVRRMTGETVMSRAMKSTKFSSACLPSLVAEMKFAGCSDALDSCASARFSTVSVHFIKFR